MTLLKSLRKRSLVAAVIFTLLGTTVFAKGVTLSGRIVDSDGKKVKKAMLTLLSGGDVIEEEKTGGNGKFKFKKLPILKGLFYFCSNATNKPSNSNFS